MNGKNQRIQKSDTIVNFVDWNIYCMFKADSASLALVQLVHSLFSTHRESIFEKAFLNDL